MEKIDFLHSFGYCIWDEERLDSWGILTSGFIENLGRNYLNTNSNVPWRPSWHSDLQDESEILREKYRGSGRGELGS